MEKFSEIKKETPQILIILICLLFFAWVYIYNTRYYVIVRFNELGPITKNMAVYYNGFKVGKITSIEPDNDFRHTLVRVNLTRKNLKLPQNTTVNVESFPTGELYLQFIYPQSPSLKTIKRGDMLEGISPYSLEGFMLGQNISGVSDIVSIHVIRALQATEIANLEMKNFFQNTSKVVNENSKGINSSVNNTVAMTKSLAEMAENLNQASRKINDSLDEKDLKDTTLNIKNSTSNIQETTGNISKATKDIDKTMKKVDDTISQLNATAENLNNITSGLHGTLRKRGAGIRILFGKPVKPQN